MKLVKIIDHRVKPEYKVGQALYEAGIVDGERIWFLVWKITEVNDNSLKVTNGNDSKVISIEYAYIRCGLSEAEAVDKFIINKENEIHSIDDSIRMARKWKAERNDDAAEDTYDARLKKLGETESKMTLVDYCRCMTACLNSQYGEYDEYCDDCLFKDCCVMNEAPDAMIEELTGYEWAAYKESQKVQDEKVAKYDKIAAIIREK